MKKYLILVGFLILNFSISKAQSINDLGLEQNLFSGWNLYTGSCCPINTTTQGLVANRHSITSGITIDSFGNFPIVCPQGGNHSLKLGNDSAGNQAESAIFTYNVNANNYHLTLAYAAVLQLASHSANTSSRFYFSVKDKFGTEIFNSTQCSYCNASPYPNVGLLTSTKDTSVKYLPWTFQNINLRKFIGDHVSIEVYSADDSLGNEFGYGYFDLVGTGDLNPKEVYCQGNSSLTLYAPQNYNYSWYYAQTGAFRGSNNPLNILNLNLGDSFDMVISPINIGQGIADTIRYNLSLYQYPKPYGGFTATPNCANALANFNDTTSLFNKVANILWNFGDALSGINNQSSLRSPSHLFSGAGNYTITETITNTYGCVASYTKSITIQNPPIVNAGNDDSVCALQPIILGGVNTASGGSGNYSYNWQSTASILNNSISNPTGLFNVSASAIVTVTDLTTNCAASDTVNIILKNNCVNHPPAANNDTFYISNVQSKTFDVLQNDIDIDGSNTTQGNLSSSFITVFSLPLHGTFQIIGSTRIQYTPAIGFVGNDSITYQINDGASQNSISNIATVVFHVINKVNIQSSLSIAYCKGNSGALATSPIIGGSGKIGYIWSPNNFLSCNDCSNPIFTSPNNAVYYLSVFDSLTNETDVDSLNVNVNYAKVNLGNDTATTYSSSSILLNAINQGSSAIINYNWSPIGSCNNCSNPTYSLTSTTKISVSINDINGCTATDTVEILACSNDCVWPGNTNNDTLINHLDLFNIGLGYGDSGFSRLLQSNVYDGYPAKNWTNNINNGPNEKYADCNGDGIINIDDVTSILQNYSPNNVVINTPQTPNDLPLLINMPAGPFQDGSHFNCDLSLGTNSIQGDSIYGVAFTFNFDPLVIDTNTISFLTFNNWMYAANNDYLDIQRNYKSKGKYEVSVVRKNHIGKSGFGSFGGMAIDIITGNVIGRLNSTKNYKLKCFVNNVRVINANGQIVASHGSADSTVIEYTPKGIDEANVSSLISLSPNPAETNVNIKCNGNLYIKKIRIINMLGENINELQFENTTSQKQINIPLQNLAKGVYLIGIETNKGTTIKRLVVSK